MGERIIKNNKGKKRKPDLQKGNSRWRRMKERYNTCLKRRVKKHEGGGDALNAKKKMRRK
jgi:hypothetical protein